MSPTAAVSVSTQSLTVVLTASTDQSRLSARRFSFPEINGAIFGAMRRGESEKPESDQLIELSRGMSGVLHASTL